MNPEHAFLHFYRLNRIARMIDYKPTMQEILNDLKHSGVPASLSAVEKSLKKLRQFYGAPIAYRKHNASSKGYYYYYEIYSFDLVLLKLLNHEHPTNKVSE